MPPNLSAAQTTTSPVAQTPALALWECRQTLAFLLSCTYLIVSIPAIVAMVLEAWAAAATTGAVTVAPWEGSVNNAVAGAMAVQRIGPDLIFLLAWHG